MAFGPLVVCDGTVHPVLAEGTRVEVLLRDSGTGTYVVTDPDGFFHASGDGLGVDCDWFLWAGREQRWFDIIAYRVVGDE